jgi:hypothetical protein
MKNKVFEFIKNIPKINTVLNDYIINDVDARIDQFPEKMKELNNTVTDINKLEFKYTEIQSVIDFINKLNMYDSFLIINLNKYSSNNIMHFQTNTTKEITQINKLHNEATNKIKIILKSLKNNSPIFKSSFKLMEGGKICEKNNSFDEKLDELVITMLLTVLMFSFAFVFTFVCYTSSSLIKRIL